MEKILDHQSSKDHYTADACVVWCFDDRFSGALRAFTESFAHFDLVRVAGGAKALAGGPSPERDFVIGQIKTSIKLHGTKQVVLMVHEDCGAYGGSKAFNNDVPKEISHHEAELAAAREYVKQEIPDAPMLCVLVRFDGVYKVE